MSRSQFTIIFSLVDGRIGQPNDAYKPELPTSHQIGGKI